jgi:hypothetical protein
MNAETERMRSARSIKESIELPASTLNFRVVLKASADSLMFQKGWRGAPMWQPHSALPMVGIRARERRGEADHVRALYYNEFNGIDPCLVLESANALVAPPSDPGARRPAEAQVGGT